jgi:sigma-B regulation protein RsbU (phosphoserine phosphatase)
MVAVRRRDAAHFSVHPALRPDAQVGPDKVDEVDVFAAAMRVESEMQAGDAPRHVLVVDDSRAQRHMVTMQLNRWGYRVTECDSGQAALDLCRAQNVDIIISDWMMPGMTGLDFCREFRDLRRESYGYFILLTSKSEKTEIADGLEAGADDFLTKPINKLELLLRVKSLLRLREMTRAVETQRRLIHDLLKSYVSEETAARYAADPTVLSTLEELKASP